jgi:hypothetical protein
MPTRLAGPSELLDAIFAQTNKLTWEDRQTILRFLSGTDFAQRTDGNSKFWLYNKDNGQWINHPIRQILLNEERRIEYRPVINSSINEHFPSGSYRSITADGNEISASSIPGTVTLKPYTIVDQIIFEMDYSNGCWKKLRRRIRMSTERRNVEDLASSISNAITSPSVGNSVEGHIIRPTGVHRNSDMVDTCENETGDVLTADHIDTSHVWRTSNNHNNNNNNNNRNINNVNNNNNSPSVESRPFNETEFSSQEMRPYLVSSAAHFINENDNNSISSTTSNNPQTINNRENPARNRNDGFMRSRQRPNAFSITRERFHFGSTQEDTRMPTLSHKDKKSFSAEYNLCGR